MADELVTDETMRDARNAWSRAIAKGSGEYGALSDALEAIAPSICLSGQIAGLKQAVEAITGGDEICTLPPIIVQPVRIILARIAALEAQK